MKGFIVKSTTWAEDEVHRVGIPESAVDVMICCNDAKEAYWSAGGIRTPEHDFLYWKGGTLKVGDEINIEFAEFNEATPHIDEQTYEAFRERIKSTPTQEKDAEYWQWKLEQYKRLKKILEEENLINKEQTDKN